MNGKQQISHLYRQMIDILKLKSMLGSELAAYLSQFEKRIAPRNIADMKNEINQFAIENDLEFIIGSGNSGYYYIDLRNLSAENKKEIEKQIDENIRTLRSRAINTLANLKVYKKTKQKIETMDQIPINIDDKGQYSF